MSKNVQPTGSGVKAGDKTFEIDTQRLQQSGMPSSNLQGTSQVIQEALQKQPPSNTAIHGALDDAKSIIQNTKGSAPVDATGHQILQHTHDVVTSAQEWLLEKNRDENIQKIATAGATAAQDTSNQSKARQMTSEISQKVDRTELQRNARELLRAVTQLAGELGRSSSFRRSIMDFFYLSGIMLSDTKTIKEFLEKSSKSTTDQSLAEQFQQQFDLGGVARQGSSGPAGQHLGGQTMAGSGMTGQMMGGSGLTSHTMGSPGMTGQMMGGSGMTGQMMGGSGMTGMTMGSPGLTGQTMGGSGMTGQTMGGSGMTGQTMGGSGMTGQTMGGSGMTGQTMGGSGMTGEKLSDEQVALLEHKFLEILRNIATRQSSKKAAVSILAIIDHLSSAVGDQVHTQQASNLTQRLNSDPQAREIMLQSRTVMERIAGGYSLETLLNTMQELFSTLMRDETAKGHFRALTGRIRTMLNDPEQIHNDAFINEGKRTLQDIRLLMVDPNSFYGSRSRIILRETRNFLNGVQEDPTNRRLQQNVQSLINDIVVRDQSGTHIRPGALDQLRVILANVLGEQLRELPLPPVHYADQEADIRISNMVLNVSDITPDHIRVKQKAKMGFSLLGRPSTEAGTGGKVKLVLENIQTHLRKVHFEYKRFKFPKIEEEGNADVDVGGQGMRIVLSLNLMADKTRPIQFSDANVNIDRLRLHVDHTKRDWMYNFFIRLFSGTIRKRIEFNMRRQLKSLFAQINEMIASASTSVSSAQGGSVKEKLSSAATNLAGLGSTTGMTSGTAAQPSSGAATGPSPVAQGKPAPPPASTTALHKLSGREE